MHSRDVVSIIFGDYVQPSGGWMPLAHLTALLGTLGHEPPAVRAMLSRMRREGLLTTVKRGRETHYSATPEFIELIADEKERSDSVATSGWSGEWTMVLYQIPESERSRREKLKRTLTDAGFGRLNPTTWISPHEQRERLHKELGCHDDPAIFVVSMHTGSAERDSALVRASWDLDEIAGYYDDFILRWEHLLTHTRRLTDEEAFRTRVTAASEWRHFPHHDPRLPQELQPPVWPAATAGKLFARVDDALGARAAAYVKGVTEQ